MTSTVINPATGESSQRDESTLAQGPYRVRSAASDIFARESHIDELAYAAGIDPVDFRLAVLDDERLAAVIEAAATRFGWRFPGIPAGRPALWAKGWLRRGAGIAAALDEGRRVATCAEVRSDRAGQLRVTRIVTAYECGALGNPDAVISQIEGAIVMAPAGMGETPLIAIAPAIANAIFAATGRRPRSVPLMPACAGRDITGRIWAVNGGLDT